MQNIDSDYIEIKHTFLYGECDLNLISSVVVLMRATMTVVQIDIDVRRHGMVDLLQAINI